MVPRFLPRAGKLRTERSPLVLREHERLLVWKHLDKERGIDSGKGTAQARLVN